MSRDDAVEFARIMQVARAARERDLEDVPELVSEQLGLEFTEDELAEVLGTLEAEANELDEEQLEQAAGGMSVLNHDSDTDVATPGDPEAGFTTEAVGEEGGGTNPWN